jgi:hypothetical protein
MKLPPLLPPYEQREPEICLKSRPEDSVDPIFDGFVKSRKTPSPSKGVGRPARLA